MAESTTRRSTHDRRSRRRSWFFFMLVGALLAGTGVYAVTNWVVGLGAGSSGEGQSATIANLTITAVASPAATNLLYPGGTGDVVVSISNLNLALQGAWSNGGNASTILCTANNKTAIDGFTSIATRFVDVDAATQSPIIGAANVFVSDYGRHTVVLHRYMRSSVILCLDPNYWAIAFLRRRGRHVDGRHTALPQHLPAAGQRPVADELAFLDLCLRRADCALCQQGQAENCDCRHSQHVTSIHDCLLV